MIARLALAFVLLGCGSPAATSSPLRVAAAASLTDVLEPIAADFTRATGREVTLRFGASSAIAEQIRAGAPTDVFVSADPRWVTELISDHAATATRAAFATNRLVVVVPADAVSTLVDLEDLTAMGHLALAGPDVPAGMHARTALTAASLLPSLEPRVVSAPDVRAALAWVAQGEADAGIVYVTDARVEPRVRVALDIPSSDRDPIVVEAVAVGSDVDADGFVSFLMGAEAQAVLEGAGFGPPP